jgi:pseudouridine synthase
MSKNRRKKWRIYQLLVSAGYLRSQDDAIDLARTGNITVNGKAMYSVDYQVHPFKDDVRVQGKKVEFKENRKYFALNKPAGIETTKENMLKYIKGKVPAEDLYSFTPVGRLDKNTTGLLIITNDGRLVKRVLNPLTKRVKVYRAVIVNKFTEEAADKLRTGITITLDDDEGVRPYKTMPAQVSIVRSGLRESEVEIGVIEGKKRQVRKMLHALKHSVKELTRLSIAKLQLGDLKPGKVREYSKEEMYRLLFE